MKKDLFDTISMYIETYERCICGNSSDNVVDVHINSFLSLHNYLFNHSDIKMHFIIDDITNMKSVLYIKKTFIKFICLTLSHYPSVLITLFSNFNLIKSELLTLTTISFDSFIALPFPYKSLEHVRNVVNANITSNHIISTSTQLNENIYNNIIHRCIDNFYYSFLNLNEYIQCTLSNIKTFYSNDDYTFKQHSSELNKVIYKQLNTFPLHINTRDQIVSSKEYEKRDMKYLSENLSKIQKLLVLSAFLAYEVKQDEDVYVFKCLQHKRKKRKRKCKYGYTLYRNYNDKGFSIHRLFSIYQCLLSYINNTTMSEVNIELICSVETLVEMGLIKEVIKGKGGNMMMRKYICGVNIEFVESIAEEFGIKLENFITLEDNWI